MAQPQLLALQYHPNVEDARGRQIEAIEGLQALQEAESKRQYRRGALVLVVVVLILIGSMGAMSAAVAYSLKDTEAAGAILASRDNKVMLVT